jgi:TPR repeat protein
MRKDELTALLSGDPAEAAPWVELAATHGLAEAQMRWGRMLLDGTGVAKDQAKALGWFRTAARSGDPDAMNMAGRCLENGWGAPKDNEAAADWYRRSAEAGHDWGEYNYANMLFDGLGVAADPAAALAWYMKAAVKGHVRAQNQAARCYEEGWGTARDPARAAALYRLSAKGGYFRGQYNYASLLAAQGQVAEAAGWFWKAAEGGTLDIRRRIGRDLLGRAEPGFHDTGLRALALCCAGGDASDWYHYGRVLFYGFRCARDEEGGVLWLRKAAEAGHGGAVAELLRAGIAIAEPEKRAEEKPPAKSRVTRLFKSARSRVG